MNSYMQQLSEQTEEEVTAVDLGLRALALRESLHLTPAEAACKAGLSERSYLDFERAGRGSVSVLLAIHHALSMGDVSDLLRTPRFDNVEQYVDHLRHRIKA